MTQLSGLWEPVVEPNQSPELGSHFNEMPEYLALDEDGLEKIFSVLSLNHFFMI